MLQLPHKQEEQPTQQMKVLRSTHKIVKIYAAEKGLNIYSALDELVKAGILKKKKERKDVN